MECVPHLALPAECMICMSAPRSVIFACGHLACCASCTDNLLATENQRLQKNACPVCRARIVVLSRSVDGGSTFRKPEGPIPPPLDVQQAASSVEGSPTYSPGHRIILSVAEPGLSGLCLGPAWRGPDGIMHSVRSVVLGSPAQEQGVPVGGVLLEINGQSVVGRPRADVRELAQARPLTVLLRAPGEGEWPLPAPEARPPLQAETHSSGCRTRLAVTLPPGAVPGEELIASLGTGNDGQCRFVVPMGATPGARVYLAIPRAPRRIRPDDYAGSRVRRRMQWSPLRRGSRA